MKTFTRSLVITCATLLFTAFSGMAAVRTWSGAVNLDFCNSGNWSGAGAILATDVLVYNGSATQTLTLSSNLTISGLTFTVSGNNTGRLDVGAYTLTVNGSSLFNSVNYSNPASFSVLYVNVNTGGNIIFNGSCNFHTNGLGDSYLTTGNFATGSTTNPGTVYFNGYLGVGKYGRTVGAYEPHMVFDANGSQDLCIKCNGGAYMFKGENVTFGSSNTPTVTIRGSGAVYFDSYDGNMSIAANTTVLVPDCTLVGYMCRMDRYSSGGGTFTMGAGSLLKTGCPNGLAPFNGWNIINNFSTYSLATTSTVWYNSTGYQGIHNNTYGNLIVDANGGAGWKYSYGGAYQVNGDFTVQGGCIYGPYNASNLTVMGNSLIQTSATWNASSDNAVANQVYTLKGNYTNNATFTSGSPVGVNTFLFNSTTSGQNIGGTSVTTFYNLTHDNTSGSGNTFTQNENVSNVWTLTNGPVYLNSKILTVQNTALAAVVRTNGYAVSETNSATNPSIITWNMGTVTGNHVFPFGVSGSYIPLTFNKTSATSANVSIATRATATSDNTPWATGVTQMYDPTLSGAGAIPATIDRWWEVNSTAAITADMTLSYRGSENTLSAPYNTGNLGAQYWSSAWLPNNSNIGSAAAVAAGVGAVTASGLSIAAAYTPWVLTSTAAPLPIELVFFGGSFNDSQSEVDLNWTTSTETNNHFFTVERSTDGETFTEVGKVFSKAPGGNSTSELSYEFVDTDPVMNGISYYRLRQTDFNGQNRTFNKLSVSAVGDVVQFVAYPNPAENNVNLTFASTGDSHCSVMIFDNSGRLVYQKQFVTISGTNILEMDISSLDAGMYMVRMEVDGKINSARIVKK